MKISEFTKFGGIEILYTCGLQASKIQASALKIAAAPVSKCEPLGAGGCSQGSCREQPGKALPGAEQRNWASLAKAASHCVAPRRVGCKTPSICPLPLCSPAAVSLGRRRGRSWVTYVERAGADEDMESNEMSSGSQRKWEADLRREECRWGRRGGDMRAWQRNWEGKPGREGVERLRLDRDQRDSEVVDLGSLWVWEEDWVQKPGEWTMTLARKGTRKQGAGGKL